ncbi:MAG: hypothetical protein ACJA1A_003131 [Saprospiraceae bacterium]|jgi:hypothetical protein
MNPSDSILDSFVDNSGSELPLLAGIVQAHIIKHVHSKKSID